MTFQIDNLSLTSRQDRSLIGIQMEITAGEPHALLGSNAAGKSLLCRLIAGYHIPTRGKMSLNGEPYAPRTPFEAMERGVHLIQAEHQLAPSLTVRENLFLGHESSRYGWISAVAEGKTAKEALARIEGGDIPLSATVARLSPSQQIRVEMARALLLKPRLLLFDNALFFENPADREILRLFIQQLKASGGMILLTGQVPSEIGALCSSYTLLRNGRVVSNGGLKALPSMAVGPWMEGENAHCPPPPPRHLGAKILSTQALSGRLQPRGISLTLHRGEIFGLFGLPQAGQSALFRLLYGLQPTVEGEIYYQGENLTSLSAAARAERGIAYLPPSLQKDSSLFDPLPLTDNLLLSRLSELSRWGVFTQRRLEIRTLDWLEKLHLYGHHPSTLASEISPEARRILALGRLFHSGVQLLLLDQPTLGLEAPLRSHLYQWFYELAMEGKALLITGSYHRELLKLCDTIGVMRNGVLAAVRPASEWSEAELIETALAGRPSLPGHEFFAL